MLWSRSCFNKEIIPLEYVQSFLVLFVSSTLFEKTLKNHSTLSLRKEHDRLDNVFLETPIAVVSWA